MNLLDDSLSVDHAAAGGKLSVEMEQRFIDLANYTKRTGCTGILFTCSAFGLAIEKAGRAVALPTLKPNEAMFDDALKLASKASASQPGFKLGLIATFAASLPSMSAELQEMAQGLGQTIHLVSAFVPEAMQDLAQGNAGLHHQKIAQVAKDQLSDCDVIMLAQFSMAAALPTVQQAVRATVLSSPDCAVLAIQKRMQA